MELLISLGIILLLVGIAAPQFGAVRETLQGRIDSYSITEFLRLSRSQALARSTRVTVCQLLQSRCEQVAAHQLSAFTDGETLGELDDSDVLLGQWNTTATNFHLETSVRYLSFLADGRANRATSFYFCHPSRVDAAHRIVISSVGRIRLGDDNDSDTQKKIAQYCF